MIRDDVDGDELLDEGLDEDELLDDELELTGDELELTGDELELTGEELELDGLLLDDFEREERLRPATMRAAARGAAFFFDAAFFLRFAAECFFFFGAGFFFFFFFISPSFPVASDYVARDPRGASNLAHNNLNLIHVRMTAGGRPGPGLPL